jgi:hypothetical protein
MAISRLRLSRKTIPAKKNPFFGNTNLNFVAEIFMARAEEQGQNAGNWGGQRSRFSAPAAFLVQFFLRGIANCRPRGIVSVSRSVQFAYRARARTEITANEAFPNKLRISMSTTTNFLMGRLDPSACSGR